MPTTPATPPQPDAATSPRLFRFFLFNEKGDLIIAKLSPRAYEEISRAHLLAPTGSAAGRA